MSASRTLNLADYTSIWDDNFASNPSINSNIFHVKWGDSGEYAASNGGLTMTDDGNAAGFLTADSGASSGDGYGLYSITFKADNTGTGAYICLWPGTNNWPGPEIDFYETLSGKAYYTVHWAGSGNSNQYQSTYFPSSVNISSANTVACDWESGSLTFYINGQQVGQFKSGGSVPIPTDYAHGGQNEAFGAGLGAGYTGASVTIYDMSYAAPKSAGSTGGTSTGGTSTGGTTTGGTTTGSTGGTTTGTGSTGGGGTAAVTPNTFITISAPGT
ncbi:MAG: family 16 glycosylhydrolase, partial [Rhodospirillales bacterium]|nr:family 16 glycosylhydrolase [Rhodospirillales bacterium]